MLPSIHGPSTRRSLKGLTDVEVQVVDNTDPDGNRGVAASWNVGVDRVLTEHHGWLVLLSAAVRFAPKGASGFAALLDRQPDNVIAVESQYGWHCIGFRREVFVKVGRFDENFWPAYWEDNDLARRVHCGFGIDPPWWPKVEVAASDAGPAHGLRLVLNARPSHQRPNPDRLLDYFTAKHGGPPSKETFTRPWGRFPLDYWPDPQPDGLGGWMPGSPKAA